MKRILIALAFLFLFAPQAESGPLPVFDCSNVITVGGTAQVLVAQGAVTNYLTVQNVSVGNLGIGLTNAPVIGNAGTIVLSPGSSFTFENSFIGNSALWIIGPTSSQAYTCWKG